jgi:hypothetical protein
MNTLETKPCEKCGKMCDTKDDGSKNRIFEQKGELYFLDDKSLCFGCFFKMSVRGK